MFKILFIVLALLGTFLTCSWFHLSAIPTALICAGVGILATKKSK